MTDLTGLFPTLHLRTSNGIDIPISCIGPANLRYRIEEAQAMEGVEIVGVSSDGKMNTDFQAFLDQTGATVEVRE
jgi:hypothetical protein